MSAYQIRARALCMAMAVTLAQPATLAAQTAPDSIRVYFDTGSASVATSQQEALDRAARLFREGNPFVMIVAGTADRVGAPGVNLQLSVQRAAAVANGLAARGIPADRLQVVGRGISELPVETPQGVPEPENRVVEITWR
ncbi:OmpA family protein [Meridianimarinicoccus roseus]|uniref:OmpA family protein n=1 Tax=Meridianimarinicoccus roseus TaxID=2072018 RepID=A0A2V2LKM2_9RHOB|nr:OmpA family protein [Meridianimarinicoccus roseus]PWR03647.1 OmpA family protein [Meridianimarinicoccus roseus]